ncbi:unnamed protein product [Oncorhynchus mykiss]|uniref:GrpE protein homolog n=1 Tax=Oncorhynchus mykiss TaxID=8022 RepID=A0A060YC16_ONCMY|nr:unnamed protein product [Oncorhynchus mykiss]
MASWCVRAVKQSYSVVSSSSIIRASPRLLCTAAQQKSGQGSEEDQHAEQSAAEKGLAEEKGQLEEQLKEVTDKYKRALADTENLRTRSQKMVEDSKLYGNLTLAYLFDSHQ